MNETIDLAFPFAGKQPGQTFSALDALKDLVRKWHVPKPDLLSLPVHERKGLINCRSLEALLSCLVDWRLLTPYQAQRILKNRAFGLVLGNYRVLDQLTGGRMGMVYRGEHLTLRQPVAIKVLPFQAGQDPRVLWRFHNEIEAVADLCHPHIVAAIDVGGSSQADDKGTVLHYFVMEYLSGHDLQKLIRLKGPPSIAEACRWVSQLASALGEAQRHRLVHRDIKPSNIFITQDGRAKLLDFGLALRRPYPVGVGAIIGTLDYMAPEQFENASAVDTRADLYSLGGVLYWCLTGQKPFPTEGREFVDFAQRLTVPPPSPRKVRPEVPRPIDMLVRRLMMLHPQDRVDSPHDVARILRTFADL